MSSCRATTQRTKDLVDAPKSNALARKNLMWNVNKKARATLAKEMKDSLTNRRPFTINNIEGQNDLKARWYKGAREITYKLLDLRKKNYKDYTIEKPPLHVKTLMKDNWLKYGD